MNKEIRNYDYYRLYLGTDMNDYEGPFDKHKLEEIEYILNTKGCLYDKYMLLLYNDVDGLKNIVAMGRIEINKKRKTR